MVITTSTYNDFKTMVSHLTSPTIYVSASSYPWQASAVKDNVAVAYNVFGAGPSSFSTDYPSAVALEQVLSFE